MNYYQPRELENESGEPSGVWHYTVRNGIYIEPVGYCDVDCEGHDTKEGAYEHWKEYLLDNANYDVVLHNQQRECEICKRYTKTMVGVGFDSRYHALCKKHNNREGLEKVIKVGDSIES